MYCPTCGLELTSELSYCNRCGANLKSAANQPGMPPAKLVGAAWAISLVIALITLGGFGMIFALLMVLVTRGVNVAPSGMFWIAFALLVIFAIDWLLVRQLSRVLDIPLLSPGATQSKKREMNERPMQQLGAPREPVPSVTENTTRTFEPIHRERDTQR